MYLKTHHLIYYNQKLSIFSIVIAIKITTINKERVTITA